MPKAGSNLRLANFKELGSMGIFFVSVFKSPTRDSNATTGKLLSPTGLVSYNDELSCRPYLTKASASVVIYLS